MEPKMTLDNCTPEAKYLIDMWQEGKISLLTAVYAAHEHLSAEELDFVRTEINARMRQAQDEKRAAKIHDIQVLINDKDAALIYLDNEYSEDMDDIDDQGAHDFIVQSRTKGELKDKYAIAITDENCEALIHSDQHYVIHDFYSRHTNVVAIRKDIITSVEKGDFNIWEGDDCFANVKLNLNGKFSSDGFREAFNVFVDLRGLYYIEYEDTNSSCFFVDTDECETNF